MKEYIDKAVFYEKIGKREEFARSRFLDTPFDSPASTRYREQMNERIALKHMVFDEPAANVVEVVHGKWNIEIDDDIGILKHTCSKCGFVKFTDIHVGLDWNWCPNCGAKMEYNKTRLTNTGEDVLNGGNEMSKEEPQRCDSGVERHDFGEKEGAKP